MMAKMTYEECRRWLHYNPDTGIATYTGVWDGHAGEVASSAGKSGRRWIHVGGKSDKAARIIHLWMTGKYPEPGMDMDHINGNPSDNRWVNLRCISHAENTRNAQLRTNNKSGIVGLRRVEDYADGSPRWVADIGVDGKTITLYKGPSFWKANFRRHCAEIRYGFHKNHGRKEALA